MTTGAWTRRRLLVLSGSLAGACALVLPLSRRSALAAEPAAAASGRRTLEMKSLHTAEVVKVTFDRGGGPDAAALAKLQHVLRDYRTHQERPMDAALFPLLCDLAEATGHEARYEIISGYRSPETNEKLRTAGHAVAEHSMHIEGRAVDVRLVGCDLETFRDAALKAARGGVGYYPSSRFVHVDTGRVRTWTGR